jgi:hypothetical protein
MAMGLGLSSVMSDGGSAAVVIEDYLWSGTSRIEYGEGDTWWYVCEVTPRFGNVTHLHVQDHNDAWDIGIPRDYTGGDPGGGMISSASTNEMMPATDPNPNYFSDDEGYWVIVPPSSSYSTPGVDMTSGQDGTPSTELTPIFCDGATTNFPIGDGTYSAGNMQF